MKKYTIFVEYLSPSEVEIVKQAMVRVQSLLATDIVFTFKETTNKFTSVAFKNDVAEGYLLDATQLLPLVDGTDDFTCLFYDWFEVSPKPTNPATFLQFKGKTIPSAIPKQWYDDLMAGNDNDINVLVEFFLHELSHAEHFRYGVKDLTHDFYSSTFTTVPGTGPRDYYVFLIKRLWASDPVANPLPVPTFTNLKFGSMGSRVNQLQKDLQTLGYFKNAYATSFFGFVTKNALIAFQKATGLTTDGIYGYQTDKALQSALKKNPKPVKRTLIEAIIQVESNGNDQAVGDKGLKYPAYGAMQIRQPVCIDVNKKFGTNYKSTDCLGNRALSIELWNKYQSIYNPNGTDEEMARTWNGGSGWKKRPHLTDGYWTKVKGLL